MGLTASRIDTVRQVTAMPQKYLSRIATGY